MFLLIIREWIVIVFCNIDLAISINFFGVPIIFGILTTICVSLNLFAYFPFAAQPPLRIGAAAYSFPECARVLLDLILESLHKLGLIDVLSLFTEIDSISRQERAWHTKLKLYAALIKKPVKYCTLHFKEAKEITLNITHEILSTIVQSHHFKHVFETFRRILIYCHTKGSPSLLCRNIHWQYDPIEEILNTFVPQIN